MTAQCKHPSINLFGTQMVQEKAMAPHSSSLAWKIPWKPTRWRSLVSYSPWGHEESDTTERLHFHFSLSCIGEGNGTHSSVPAWRIPGTRGLVGFHLRGRTVGHDWSDLAAVAVAADGTGLAPHTPSTWGTRLWLRTGKISEEKNNLALFFFFFPFSFPIF